MRTLRFYLSMVVVVAMLLGSLACLSLSTSAAAAPEYVKDGLVAWYDGSNNSNGEQDYESTIWRDLSGNKNHLQVRVDETNYWKDNAFHLDSASYYFPEALVDVVNSEAYTIEFSAGDLDLKATDWITLMCSDNDEFSLFIRVPKDDERDNLEYKYNDKNQDRPKVEDGAAALESDGIGSTIAITFDMNAEGGPVCIIYINGTEAGRGVPEYTNIADTLTIGHDNPQRAWAADMYSIRFYNRALTPAEIQDNAEADDEKYRFGINYPPTVEYDDSGEVFEDAVTGDFVNNIIPLTEELDLVAADGFYGTLSINDEQLFGDWTGIRVTPSEVPDQDSGYDVSPTIQINYSKFCRRAGLPLMTGEEAQYVVVKMKVESGKVGDMNLLPAAGDTHSWFEAGQDSVTTDKGVDSSGEIEYLLFDMADSWSGSINLICLQFLEMEPNAVAYVEEVRLFATMEEAYAYAGAEMPTTEAETEEPVEDKTEASTTDAPTTDAPEATTEAPEQSEGGCKSVVAASVVAVVAAAAACVALKKKD